MKHSKAYKKRKKGALKNTSNKKILKTTEVSKDTFKLLVFNILNSAEIDVKAQNLQKKQRNVSKMFLSEVSLWNIPPTPKEISSQKNPAESPTNKVKKR